MKNSNIFIVYVNGDKKGTRKDAENTIKLVQRWNETCKKGNLAKVAEDYKTKGLERFAGVWVEFFGKISGYLPADEFIKEFSK